MGYRVVIPSHTVAKSRKAKFVASERKFEHVFDRDEVRGRVAEQVKFLRSSNKAYDNGELHEAKRLSSCVYILLYDGKGKAKSLLGQLGLRDGLKLLSTAQACAPGYGIPLCSLHIATFAGASFSPLLDRADSSREVRFDEWWNEVVFIAPGLPQRSRAEVVKTMRDKDGGAHGDASQTDEAYHALATDAAKAVRVAPAGNDCVVIASPKLPDGVFALANPPRVNLAPSKLFLLKDIPPAGTVAPEVDHSMTRGVPNGHFATMRQIAWEVDEALKATGL